MKTEVYSWRLSPRRKSELEAEARRQGASLAELLEDITRNWLSSRQQARQEEESEQQRLHARAEHTFGAIAGGDLHRSQRARLAIRRRLRQRHGAQRPR